MSLAVLPRALSKQLCPCLASTSSLSPRRMIKNPTKRTWQGQLFRGATPPTQLAVPLYDPPEAPSEGSSADLTPASPLEEHRPDASHFAVRLDTLQHPSTATPLEDPLLHYFVSAIVRKGKRRAARQVLVQVLHNLRRTCQTAAMPLLRQAVEAAMPFVTTARIRRSAVKAVVVPKPLVERQRLKIALKLILEASEKRRGQLADRLSTELLAILNNESPVLQRVRELHQEAAAVRGEVAQVKRGTNTRRNTMYRY